MDLEVIDLLEDDGHTSTMTERTATPSPPPEANGQISEQAAPGDGTHVEGRSGPMKRERDEHNAAGAAMEIVDVTGDEESQENKLPKRAKKSSTASKVTVRRRAALMAFDNEVASMDDSDRRVALALNGFLTRSLQYAREKSREFAQPSSSSSTSATREKDEVDFYNRMWYLYTDIQEYITACLDDLHYGRYKTSRPVRTFASSVQDKIQGAINNCNSLFRKWQVDKLAANFPGAAAPSSSDDRLIPPSSNTMDRIEENVDHIVDTIHRNIEPYDIPPQLDVTVLEHQRLGLGWLVKREKGATKGGILADDMGLGKTVQTIALIYANPAPEDQPSSQPRLTLIVCPLSLVSTWSTELERRVKPGNRLRVYVHNNNSNKKLLRDADVIQHQCDIVITTYDTLRVEFKAKSSNNYTKPHPLTQIHWWRVVLDEAQNIKNDKAVSSLACADLWSVHRLCLTGTPMQNDVRELWSLIRFLRIKPYWDDRALFERLCPEKRLKLNDTTSKEQREAISEQRLERLRALLASILLRRKKNTLIAGKPILANLPSKTVRDILVDLQEEEKDHYLSVETRTKEKANALMKAEFNYSNILTLLLRLRQLCCHRLLARLTHAKKHQSVPLPDFTELSCARSLLAMPESSQHWRTDKSCPACGETGLSHQATVVLYPCQHTVCQDCAVSLSQYYPIIGDPKGSLCPSCSRPVAQQLAFLVIQMILDYPYYDDNEIIIKFQHLRKSSRVQLRRAAKERKETLLRLAQKEDREAAWSSAFSDSDDSFFSTSGKRRRVKVEASVDRAIENESEEAELTTQSEEPSIPISCDTPETALESLVASSPVTEEQPDELTELSEQDQDHDQGATASRATSSQQKDLVPSSAGDDHSLAGDAHPLAGNDHFPKAGKKWDYKLDINEVAKLYPVPDVFKDGWTFSAKTNAFMELLHDIWETDPSDKVIVFSYFTAMLDMLTIPLDSTRIDYLTYTGEMDAQERSDTLVKFSTSPVKVLLISLRAGNVGLTLTDANRVVIMEPFWNPYVEEQAKDRVHRIGQSKPVTVYRLLTRNTVEDRIVQLQKRKMEIIEAALSAEGREKISSLNREELQFILGMGRPAGHMSRS